MVDAIVINVTTGTKTEAQHIAAALIEGRVAACVQMHSIESTFSWDGAVTRENEVLLVIKTRASLFGAVEAIVRTHHSYEVPEIVGFAITHASAPYLAWVEDETREG